MLFSKTFSVLCSIKHKCFFFVKGKSFVTYIIVVNRRNTGEFLLWTKLHTDRVTSSKLKYFVVKVLGFLQNKLPQKKNLYYGFAEFYMIIYKFYMNLI